MIVDWTTPMIHFYEPKYQVEGIHELWNTLSNFWFILVGLQLLRRKSPIAEYVILVGICSGMFHGTGTLFWEAADELSILVLVYAMGISLKPNLKLKPIDSIPFLLYGLAIYFHKFWIFYLILTVPVLGTLIHLEEQATQYNKYHMFSDMMMWFLIGKVFWYAEQFSYLYPGNNYLWLGHSIWHFCSAFAMGHAGLIIDLSRQH